MTNKLNFNLKTLNNTKRYSMNFPDFEINNVSQIKDNKSNSIAFSKDTISESDVVLKESLIISHSDSKVKSGFGFNNNFYLLCDNPRLEFAYILSYYRDKLIHEIYDNYSFVKTSNIGKNTIIEPNVFIESQVTIGENCYIESGAKIYNNVSIGDRTRIGANSTIGLDGFGVETDKDGRTYKIPHFGGVIIGNDVNISSLCNVHAGTINPTIIEDNVQIDTLVHIAHNCFIKQSSIIAGGSMISGSTIIEKNVYVGPNCSIINKIIIGEGSVIGIGSVVIRDVRSNTVVSGNPARIINF